jgi:hypothetical protein
MPSGCWARSSATTCSPAGCSRSSGLSASRSKSALCVRILAGGWSGGLIGAFWFVAIMSHNSSTYVGANDPQLAGEAIMGAGLVLMLARDAARKSVTPALLIMVVGGFWKHNMIAIPLTAVTWLFLSHGRRAVRPVAVSALAAGAGLLICGAVYGKAFFQNLLVARDYSVSHVPVNVGHLQWSAAAMMIWASWVATTRSTAARFTMLHVPIGLFACLLQWTGDAIFGNAEFDLLLALGIATGVTFEEIKLSVFALRFGAGAAQAGMVAILALRLIASDRQEPALVLFDPGFRSQLKADERSARAEAVRVWQVQGDVFCTNKVICRLAGKPFVVDDLGRTDDRDARHHQVAARRDADVPEDRQGRQRRSWHRNGEPVAVACARARKVIPETPGEAEERQSSKQPKSRMISVAPEMTQSTELGQAAGAVLSTSYNVPVQVHSCPAG